ncbi:MAG: Dabb family protein [Verrucomicrobiota bacterium JB023]|nr:Dabb family protein [Verrucomicrobiota bacterium JB023]
MTSAIVSAHETQPPASEVTEGAVRHVVLVKFKEDATEEQIAHIEAEFGKLEDKIETIRGYEWGPAFNGESGRTKGYTHCFVVTFDDKEGLAAYGPHEEHQKFVKILLPVVEDVLVLDYVAQ